MNSLLKLSRKGFAFTFLAFFVSLLIFAFIYLNMTKYDYTKDNVFKDSRISFVNDEINYFKSVYLKDSMSYSLYNVFNCLINHTANNNTFYSNLNQNYSKLNSVVKEGLLNGSFDGVSQDCMENKTFDYFLNTFKSNFFNNSKGNISFDVSSLAVYEENPYYMSVQVYAYYNITTLDNISVWNFDENVVLSIPIFDLRDPEFLLQGGHNITIRPTERYLSDENLTLEVFRDIINKSYSTVYFEPNYKYTIGGSFLSRLLNISLSSYKDVMGFWSFDYDEEEMINGTLIDTSQYSSNTRQFGNSRFLFSFDNSTTGPSYVGDLSSYRNDAVLNGGVVCDVNGVRSEACEFDGVDGYLNLTSKMNDLVGLNEGSVSGWFKTSHLGDVQNILGLTYMLDESDHMQIFLGDSTGSYSDESFVFVVNNGTERLHMAIRKGHDFYSDGNWHHFVVVTGNGDNGIYIDGVREDVYFRSGDISTREFSNISDPRAFHIGRRVIFGNDSNFFNGTIDELAIYSKALSEREVGELFREKKALNIDYKDSYHGRGIEFDGIDDYINASDDLGVSNFMGSWTIESWFKPYNVSREQSIVSKDGPFMLGLNESRVQASVYTTSGWDSVYGGELENFYNYHAVLVWNATDDNLSLYVNGIMINKSESFDPIDSASSNGDFFIGGGLDFSDNFGLFFEGKIDEVKIYNYSLTESEIIRNYYNYKEFGKGCCNYITLINPNKMGYNSTSYSGNVSYSSKLFYDKWNKDIFPYEVLIYNITNVTSSIPSENYYNFHVDKCIADAYNVFTFENANISVDFVNEDTAYNDSNDCENLIGGGIY